MIYSLDMVFDYFILIVLIIGSITYCLKWYKTRNLKYSTLALLFLASCIYWIWRLNQH
ncbi:hypothetical protein D3C72_850860 [compost metagenome]